MKILFVFNNSAWESRDKKIAEVKAFFDGGQTTKGFNFAVAQTKFDDVPFSPYNNGDPAMNGKVFGVDPKWYDQNITSLGIGYDMVLFVLPRKQWKEPNRARGWRTDGDQGPIQLQIACDEDETSRAGGWGQFSRKTSAFFLLSVHEILHGLFMMSGQQDMTHYYWDRGQLEKARDMIRLPENYSLPGLIRSLNYLQTILKTLTLAKETPNQKIINYARTLIGKDASPLDKAPDGLGCAETVSTILNTLFPGFPIVTGTYTLIFDVLAKRKDFKRIDISELMEGDILGFATGTGNGLVEYGHIGIVEKGGIWLSNNSKDGKFDGHITIAYAKKNWIEKGGYPPHCFRKVA